MPSKSPRRGLKNRPRAAKAAPGRPTPRGEQPATRRAAQPKATEPGNPTPSQAEIDQAAATVAAVLADQLSRRKSAGPRSARNRIDQGAIAVAIVREGLDAAQLVERFGVSRSYAFRVIAWAKSLNKGTPKNAD